MTDSYRIFGSVMSPYSEKVRAWFRYKDVPHDWLERRPDNIAEYQKYAKLPLVPLVITPEPAGMQDSTPIIETLEVQFPESSICSAVTSDEPTNETRGTMRSRIAAAICSLLPARRSDAEI